MFTNLEAFALGMGFQGITLEFLHEMHGNVGAFTRLAVQNGIPAEIAVAAKREFILFMEMGKVMFAPVTEGEFHEQRP